MNQYKEYYQNSGECSCNNTLTFNSAQIQMLKDVLGFENRINQILALLEHNYVKISDIWQNKENGTIGQQYTIDDLPIVALDDHLSDTSTNAVQNKVIKAALDQKMDKTTFKTINGELITGSGDIIINSGSNIDTTEIINQVLSVAASKEQLLELQRILNLKQNILRAGFGISIDNNEISVTIDNELYLLVDQLPQQGVTNKLYLLKEGDEYIQYVYKDNQWVRQGAITAEIRLENYVNRQELENYLTSQEASELFQTKGNYITTNDLIAYSTIEKLNQKIQELYSRIENEFSKKNSPTVLPDTYDVTYTSNIQNGITTTVSLGNIQQGTDVEDLKGKTFSELMDQILFKEIWPNIPSHSIGFNLSSYICSYFGDLPNELVSAQWNNNVQPVGEIQYEVTHSEVQGLGPITYQMQYSYPNGITTLISNLGNTKEVVVQGQQDQIITKVVNITLPIYINNVEKGLYPANQEITIEEELSGSPIIEIPGDNSQCTIQADLGFGYMDVSGWVTSTVTHTGDNNKTYPYTRYTKTDSYQSPVRHKIIYKII